MLYCGQQVSANFSVNNQMVNILGIMGHVVSATAAQLYH